MTYPMARAMHPASEPPAVPRGSVTQALVSQAHILQAIMMHDIKSRFFGNGIGYVLMMLWPLVHIVALLIMFTSSGRVTPYGNSLLLYIVTGVMPFIAFSYISRNMVLGVLMNKSYLQYPIIRVNDILIGRALLEVVSMFCVVVAVYAGISMLGVDCTPDSPTQASAALLATILLGVGLGYLNSIITLLLPMWNIVYTISIMLVYAGSGIVFVPESLPAWAQYDLSFNPVLQTVIWMRAAYFGHTPVHMLDKTYVLGMGFGTFAAGLVLERLLRQVLIQAR